MFLAVNLVEEIVFQSLPVCHLETASRKTVSLYGIPVVAIKLNRYITEQDTVCDQCIYWYCTVSTVLHQTFITIAFRVAVLLPLLSGTGAYRLND